MRKLFLPFIATLVLLFAFSTTGISAAKILTNDKGTITVAKTEVINDDLFVSAQTVVIDGTINGDVFIGAQTTKIAGTINGNLHLGTQTVDVAGIVKGNVYVGAQDISVTGSNIGGSLFAGGQNITVDKTSVIGGSIFTGAAMFNLDSQVKRNVFVGAGNITIGPNTKIGKDLYYAAGQNAGQVNISDTAKITGTVHKSEAKIPEKEIQNAQNQIPAFLKAVRATSLVLSFIGALIIGFIYFKLFGQHSVKSINNVSKSFWKSLGVGFVVSIAFIPALIILLITIIGIPVAGLGFLLLIIYFYLSKIVVGASLGNFITKRLNWKVSAFAAFTIGILVFYILKLIPFVGGLTGLVVFWVGLGALTIATFSKN